MKTAELFSGDRVSALNLRIAMPIHPSGRAPRNIYFISAVVVGWSAVHKKRELKVFAWVGRARHGTKTETDSFTNGNKQPWP